MLTFSCYVCDRQRERERSRSFLSFSLLDLSQNSRPDVANGTNPQLVNALHRSTLVSDHHCVQLARLSILFAVDSADSLRLKVLSILLPPLQRYRDRILRDTV